MGTRPIILHLVKVTLSPNNEIVVHEIIEQEGHAFFEDMVRQALASPVHAEPTINWAEGVAFVMSLMPPTEDIVKENLAGRVHCAAVLFTRAPYQGQIMVKIGNQEYSARLRRVESNQTMLALARFLKDYHADSKPV